MQSDVKIHNTEAYCPMKERSWLYREILGHSDIQGRQLFASTSGILVETSGVWPVNHCEDLFYILFYSKGNCGPLVLRR